MSKQNEADLKAQSFQEIDGIGKKSEEKLHKAGVLTFEDIFTSTADELSKITSRPSKLIKSEDWKGQAKRIHLAILTQQEQRYARYTVVLLLDEQNEVRRTEVNEVTIPEKSTWAGWEPDRLVDFIENTAGIEPELGEAEVEQESELEDEVLTWEQDLLEEEVLPTIGVVEINEPLLSPPQSINEGGQVSEFTTLKPALSLKSVEILPGGYDTPYYFLQFQHPYTIRVLLEMPLGSNPAKNSCQINLTIFADRLGSTGNFILGKLSKVIEAQDDLIELTFSGQSIPIGSYTIGSSLFTDMKDGLLGDPSGMFIENERILHVQ